MKEDAIIDVLKSRLKKLESHFLKLGSSFDRDELHNYRLEMKKMNAFLRLLNTDRQRQEQVKLNQAFKMYNKQLGNLRNLQLHEQRLQEIANERNWKQPVAYLSLLEIEKTKVIEQLRIEQQRISFKKLRKELFSPNRLVLKANTCDNYLMNQRNTLVAILIPISYSDDALHEVRKIVKDIGYNRSYLGSHMSLLLPAMLVKKESVDSLSEQLGVFHDLCISQYLLQLPLAKEINDRDEGIVLQEMRDVMDRKKKQMKEALLKQLVVCG